MLKILLPFCLLLFYTTTNACSIVYYIDSTTGKIFVANNEDYWFDVKDYIQIIPEGKNEHARLWYGWKNFAQGGINSKGLFFDAAVTPEQTIPIGYQNPNGRNVGDKILAHCTTVVEAVAYLEKEKIAVSTGHIMLGDATGNAVLLEWVDGKKKSVNIKDNALIVTNFLISKKEAGNYPCPRYESIQHRIQGLNENNNPIDLRTFGNVIAGAVQPKRKIGDKECGTLYTSVINITDMEFVLVPKLNKDKIIQLDLKTEFKKTRKRKIKLHKI